MLESASALTEHIEEGHDMTSIAKNPYPNFRPDDDDFDKEEQVELETVVSSEDMAQSSIKCRNCSRRFETAVELGKHIEVDRCFSSLSMFH